MYDPYNQDYQNNAYGGNVVVPRPISPRPVSPRPLGQSNYGEDYYRSTQANQPWDGPGYARPPSPYTAGQTYNAYGARPPSPRISGSPRFGAGAVLPQAGAGYNSTGYLNPNDPYGTSYAPIAQRVQIHPAINGDLPPQDPRRVVVDLSALVMQALSPASMMPVPLQFLTVPATNPPVSRMRISCAAYAGYGDYTPDSWVIEVGSSYGMNGQPITVLNVLEAIHAALRTPISQLDWARLQPATESEVSQAYTRRCRAAGAATGSDIELQQELSQGVRRIDFLRYNNMFGGLVRQREDDMENFRLLVRPR